MQVPTARRQVMSFEVFLQNHGFQYSNGLILADLGCPNFRKPGNPHFQENLGAIQPGFGLHMAIQVETV